MALAAFSGAPQNAQDLAQWSFAHAAHHRDIVRLIQQTFGVPLNEFILDPFDIDHMENWLWNHQQMHSEMDGVLGINSADLTSLDWEDPQATNQWMGLHATEHYQAGQILSLG